VYNASSQYSIPTPFFSTYALTCTRYTIFDQSLTFACLAFVDTEAAAEVEEAEAEGAMIDMMTDTGPEGPHQGIVEEVEVEEEDTMTDAGLPGTMMVEARLLLDMMIGATMIGGTRRGGEVLAIFRVRCTSVV